MKKKHTPPKSSCTVDAPAPADDAAGQERQEETEALLQILELGDREIEVGQTERAEEVLARLRKRFESA